jgi:hypothetical protein
MNQLSIPHARKALLTAVAVLCLATSGIGHAQSIAGVVKKKEGTVQIIRDGKPMPADIGTAVRAGDTVKTEKDSSVGLMLKDESRMSLGPNSQMSLDKFGFNANTYQGNMLVSVLKGTFAMISGLVVKNNPGAALIKTPTSTAGIRGTTFVVEVP